MVPIFIHKSLLKIKMLKTSALYFFQKDLAETLRLVSISMEDLASVNISSMEAVVEMVTDLNL